jgi:hypothetical protein
MYEAVVQFDIARMNINQHRHLLVMLTHPCTCFKFDFDGIRYTLSCKPHDLTRMQILVNVATCS